MLAVTRAEDWQEWERRNQERVRPYLDDALAYWSTQCPELFQRPANRRERTVGAAMALIFTLVALPTGMWFGFVSLITLEIVTGVLLLWLPIEIRLLRWARRTG